MFPGFSQIVSAVNNTKEYIVVTDQVLRWRDSDRASSNGFISEGEKVQFIEEKGTDWFKVKGGGNEGYVRRGELTSVKNYKDETEATIHQTLMKEEENLDELIVTIDVSLRTKDEMRYRPITLLKRGAEVIYEGTTQKDWFKVDYEGQKGYVYRGDVTSKKNWENDDKALHETDMSDKEDFGKLEVLFDVNLKTKDENQYRPITLLSKGEIVHYQGTTQKNWFKVKNEAGDVGYVYRGNLTKYEDLDLRKDTVLEKDESFVNVVENEATIDLNRHKVGTLTVISNNTVIKNGEVRNIIIGKDVKNLILEDIIDDGEGKHNFGGGGSESIILKGNTNLKSNIHITSNTPIQIRSLDLKEGKGLQGKIIIDTGAAVTITTPVPEVQVIKENKKIILKAEVGKVTASANIKVIVAEGVKEPELKKEEDVVVTIEPEKSTPPSLGGGGGDIGGITPSDPEVEKFKVKSIRVVDARTISVTFEGVEEPVRITVVKMTHGKNKVTFTYENQYFTETVDYVDEEIIALEEANAAVEKAEKSKIQKDIDTARGLVDKLIPSDIKENLVKRLNDIKIPEGSYKDYDYRLINNDKEVEIVKYRGNTSKLVIPSEIENKPVTSIGARAFFNTYLTQVKIPVKVTSIEAEAFTNNYLKNIEIPEGVKNIGYRAFSNNILTSVKIPNGMTEIENEVFYNNELVSVIIPETILSIGAYAFRYNQLTSVDIPNSVRNIEHGTFSNNELISLDLPINITSIGAEAFSNNELTSVKIPDGVIEIGYYAFRDNKLTSVSIPEGILSMGHSVLVIIS